MVPCGSTGEAATLDLSEHARVIEVVIDQCKGRVPVIAGVGANSTREALERHRTAKRLGARAGLSVNPYYNKPSQEGMYRHFMTLADAVDLPIVLYNVPGRTGVTMAPATVARLRNHPNIAAIKDSTGNLDIASEIQCLCDINILSGDDSLNVPFISIGAVGAISVVSNLLPHDVAALVTSALAGDFKEAHRVHKHLFMFTKAIFLDGNPGGIKYAMKRAGMDTGELRLPLVEYNESAQNAINAAMEQAR